MAAVFGKHHSHWFFFLFLSLSFTDKIIIQSMDSLG